MLLSSTPVAEPRATELPQQSSVGTGERITLMVRMPDGSMDRKTVWSNDTGESVSQCVSQ